jgi:hypothetical protein
MSDVPHDIGYVLGNGPSRDRSKTRYDGVTYGCNSIHTEMDVDVLVCMDAWYQFEVIASGYPAAHECLFGGYNPMPVGIKPEDLNPPHYGIIMLPVLQTMNEQRKRIMRCLTGNLTVAMSVG